MSYREQLYTLIKVNKRVFITYFYDFNDFVESSEYVALIDLIAYISQALSFRVDLNARENFLETAERRNSVLRLARFNLIY